MDFKKNITYKVFVDDTVNKGYLKETDETVTVVKCSRMRLEYDNDGFGHYVYDIFLNNNKKYTVYHYGIHRGEAYVITENGSTIMADQVA